MSFGTNQDWISFIVSFLKVKVRRKPQGVIGTDQSASADWLCYHLPDPAWVNEKHVVKGIIPLSVKSAYTCKGSRRDPAVVWADRWIGSSAVDDGLIQSYRADHRKPIQCIVTGRLVSHSASPDKPESLTVRLLELPAAEKSTERLISAAHCAYLWTTVMMTGDSRAFHAPANVH